MGTDTVSWGCPSQLSLCSALAVSHSCSLALVADVGQMLPVGSVTLLRHLTAPWGAHCHHS